ncbi:MAG: Re/Si-specific NAD(P)(+) transhydrogenase subunit alpha [Pirellulales bacterium]|nr:Re/Si-specific NAD(P)(+) transhydrogenase subunit alpha [Pirellulales bacterium]
MRIGIPKETFPGENRVALVPNSLLALNKQGFKVIVEQGAGTAAGFSDAEYERRGAQLVADRSEVFSADVILQVRSAGANPEAGASDMPQLTGDQTVIGFCEPLSEPQTISEFAKHGATLFSMETIPRITRAQSMDALSSMATVAGYKAALLAASALPKMFPMMMTAAGTIAPAKVFVVGAGVAGLQSIASCRKLGAVVSAYDIRPAVKEEVESLGAKFLEFDLDTEQAQGSGGYAKEAKEEFYAKQREMMLNAMADHDVVITTAAVPGRKAPILVTKEMVERMQPGSVIVDLAAERGGNCELTCPGETVMHNGVTVLCPVNLPAEVPFDASTMYAKNISTLLLHLTADGAFQLDMDDEITRETLIVRSGEVVHPVVRDALGLPAVEQTAAAVEASATESDSQTEKGNV